MKHYLYILKSETADKYYIGISKHSLKRLEYHNTVEKGFTSRYRPWKIVFSKEYASKEEAMMIQRKIKGWKNKSAHKKC
ncbi:MAG: excinuclease ABC subunit C [Ignavibacteria bacterium RBG_16_34_14]|nr:MAG: excinuclease ABC subunit C [Ignavibacteria bacterium RBG_16_34_14]